MEGIVRVACVGSCSVGLSAACYMCSVFSASVLHFSFSYVLLISCFARFFANSSSYTTTSLSKVLTSCFTAIKNHWKNIVKKLMKGKE